MDNIIKGRKERNIVRKKHEDPLEDTVNNAIWSQPKDLVILVIGGNPMNINDNMLLYET